MHDDTQTSDTELIKLSLSDPKYFTPLVERYEPKLFRYIRRFSGLSRECIEDVLQEVFIKVYRNLNDFDADLKFSSWIYRITHNETVNYLRKNRGKETAPLETDDPDMLNLIEVIESNTDILNETRKKELRDHVKKVLDDLSPAYREVLILRFLEELDYAEISDVLKKPVGTVGTLLNRAKTHFKQLAIDHHLNLKLHE